jgi:hypothetical protein
MSRHTYILLLVLFAGCHEQTSVTHRHTKKIAAIKQHADDIYRHNWKIMQLSGRVQSVIEFTFNKEVADTTITGYVVKDHYSFDSSGNMAERTIYNSDRFDSKSEYFYNKQNKTTEIRYYAEDGSYNFKEYYIFDVHGNLLESGENHYGSIARAKTFKYDEDNSVIESTVDGKVTRYENTYDKEGLLSSQLVSFDTGIKGVEKTEYDSVGNLLEKGRYYTDGTLFYKMAYVYDEYSLPIKTTTTDKDNKVTVFNSVYDSHHNLTENTEMSQKISHMSYEYDSKGNWIKKTTRDEDNNISSVMTRRISYY